MHCAGCAVMSRCLTPVDTHVSFVPQENDSGTLDTVGAVVVDHEGNVAAAVSSGGLALKHPGRVGQVRICELIILLFKMKSCLRTTIQVPGMFFS